MSLGPRDETLGTDVEATGIIRNGCCGGLEWCVTTPRPWPDWFTTPNPRNIRSITYGRREIFWYAVV